MNLHESPLPPLLHIKSHLPTHSNDTRNTVAYNKRWLCIRKRKKVQVQIKILTIQLLLYTFQNTNNLKTYLI